MGWLDFIRRPKTAEVQRFSPQLPAWPDPRFPGFGVDGLGLAYTGLTMSTQPQELIEDTYAAYVLGAYKTNGVVFAVSLARQLLFSEARFKWRKFGQAGGGNDLFGNQDLQLLEAPWPGGTTQDLLGRMEQDVTNGGTTFVVREGDRLRRLRPDWTEFVLSAPPAYAAEVDIVGFKYTVGGPGASGETRLYLADEVAYWAPIPDPLAQFRGMSWLTPVIRELQADQAMVTHKQAFFENAATPNLSVALKDTVTIDQFRAFKASMDEAHGGPFKAGKTLYLGGGADVTVVGANLQQLDFRNVQGAGETRIAAAGRVPPIVVGLSEGLAAATYSNYSQARRAFADSWARPQWRSVCGALAAIMDVPSGAELWYDDRDIAFLREDREQAATIRQSDASTIQTLVNSGWKPDSVRDAVLAEDWSLLEHSGLLSVQLQPPPDPNATPADPVGGEEVPALEAPPVDAPPEGADPETAAADAEGLPG